MKKTKAAVEKIVLKTFQEEIPSIYYSDKSRSEYKKFVDIEKSIRISHFGSFHE